MTPDITEIEKRLEEIKGLVNLIPNDTGTIRADYQFLLDQLATAEQALAEATRENERLREALQATDRAMPDTHHKQVVKCHCGFTNIVSTRSYYHKCGKCGVSLPPLPLAPKGDPNAN